MSGRNTNGVANNDRHIADINRQFSNLSFNGRQNSRGRQNPQPVESNSPVQVGVRSDHIILGIFHPKENGSRVSEGDMKKMEDIVWFSLWKFEEVRVHTHGEAGIELFYERHEFGSELIRSDDTILLHIYISDTAEKVRAYTNFPMINLTIPSTMINDLVDSQESFSEATWKSYDHITCHVIHELAHACGCFHSSFGLMSGVTPLFKKNQTNFELWSVMDELSLNIIAEKFSRVKCSEVDVSVNYELKSRRLTFSAPIEMIYIVFLKNQTYASVYKVFTTHYEFTAPSDDDWDYVQIHLVYGQHTLYSKTNAKVSWGTPSRQTVF